MKILAIESSCDETSASVIENSIVLSNVISSQYFHSKYGGVIPELASRAHLDYIYEVVADSLKQSNTKISDISAIAVTTEPGLIGSLLVGSNFAKGLSIKYNLPLIPVNHIEGHLYSGCLQDKTIEFPFITLVVSGGHTALFYVESYSNYTILGSTVDDAAGEAFDKIATLLGLEYPGGPHIDKNAISGNPKAYDFPRSMIHSNDNNFSFSGLKTSVRYFLHNEFNNNVPIEKISDLCASVQQAIVDVLVSKSIKVAIDKNVKHLVIAGGVSANSQLRKDMKIKAEKFGIKVIAPDLQYCMDNAAMIGFLAEKRFQESQDSKFMDLTFRVNASALRAKRKK
jgi:N6-L-threonylcarbamoyladenine synthase